MVLLIAVHTKKRNFKYSILGLPMFTWVEYAFLTKVYNFPPLLCLLSVSSSITNITGQNVLEGGNVTLKCLAEGKPKPTITWIRLSDNQAVTMPLININRNDPRGYRCTASNGVGIPATREIFIDVQCKCSSLLCTTYIHKKNKN